jgi:hypothetical protein
MTYIQSSLAGKLLPQPVTSDSHNTGIPPYPITTPLVTKHPPYPITTPLVTKHPPLSNHYSPSYKTSPLSNHYSNGYKTSPIIQSLLPWLSNAHIDYIREMFSTISWDWIHLGGNLLYNVENSKNKEKPLNVQWLAKVFAPLELCDLLPHFRLQT